MIRRQSLGRRLHLNQGSDPKTNIHISLLLFHRFLGTLNLGARLTPGWREYFRGTRRAM